MSLEQDGNTRTGTTPGRVNLGGGGPGQRSWSAQCLAGCYSIGQEVAEVTPPFEEDSEEAPLRPQFSSEP